MTRVDNDGSPLGQLLGGPRFDATLSDILPLGDGLPRIHLPSAALSSLGVQLDGSAVVVLVTAAHASATRTAASTGQHGQGTGDEPLKPFAGVVAAFATLTPKLRAGEVSLSPAALDALTCLPGSAVTVGSALHVFCAGSSGGGRVQAGPPGLPCLAVCESVTLQLLPPSHADVQPAGSLPELEESLRRASLSTPPRGTPPRGKTAPGSKSPAPSARAQPTMASTRCVRGNADAWPCDVASFLTAPALPLPPPQRKHFLAPPSHGRR
jgi:hypothetical protein